MPDITVVVPTFNRSQHIERCLQHFIVDENSLRIVVADGSSDQEHRKRNETAVSNVKGALNIDYLGYPIELGFFQRCSVVADQVSTNYLVFHSDDDFLFSSGIAAAAELMENNPKITVAQGNIMHIGRTKNDLMNVATYPFSPISISDPIERLKWHMRGYRPTFYSTHRTKNCAKALTATSQFTSPWLRFTEITAASLIALQGHLGFVDVLYGVRESHPAALSRHDMNWPDILLHENFSNTLQEFIDVLGPFITELNPQVSAQEADNWAREAFLEFLKMVMVPQTRPIPQHIIDQTWGVFDVFEEHPHNESPRKLLSNILSLMRETKSAVPLQSVSKKAFGFSLSGKKLLRILSRQFG